MSYSGIEMFRLFRADVLKVVDLAVATIETKPRVEQFTVTFVGTKPRTEVFEVTSVPMFDEKKLRRTIADCEREIAAQRRAKRRLPKGKRKGS